MLHSNYSCFLIDNSVGIFQAFHDFLAWPTALLTTHSIWKHCLPVASIQLFPGCPGLLVAPLQLPTPRSLSLFFKCQGPQASGLVFPSPFLILWWHNPALYPLLFIPVDTKPKVYMKWLQLSFVFLFYTELPNLIGRLMIWPEGYAMVRNRSAILWQEKSIQIQPTLIVNYTYYGLAWLPYIGYVI